MPPHRATCLQWLPTTRALTAAVWLVTVLIAAPAVAGVVDSPECRRDLAVADQLVHAGSAAREQRPAGRFRRAVPALAAEPPRHEPGARADGPMHDRARS